MTWKELKEKAKEIGYIVVKKAPYEREVECLVNDYGYAFYRDGVCEFDCNPNDNLCGHPFAGGRTPSQMWQIMEALK